MVHWLVQSSFKSWRVPPFPSVIPIWGLGEEENVWDFSDSECAWTGSTDKCSAVSKDLVFLVSFSFSVSLLALYLATTDTTEASVVRSQQLIEYAHACLCGVTFWIVSCLCVSVCVSEVCRFRAACLYRVVPGKEMCLPVALKSLPVLRSSGPVLAPRIRFSGELRFLTLDLCL